MTHKLWSDSVYYYGTNDLVKNTIKVSVEFAAPIDAGMLRRALDITQGRYPYFSVRRVKTEREILLEDNPLPWVLKQQDTPVTLGGAESNGHMIAFRYAGSWLYADFFHGLTDAAGFLNLLRTLCYYYCREAYDRDISPEGIWLAEDPILPEEVDDPYGKLPPRAADKPTAKKKPEYMNLAEENHYACTGNHVFRVAIPQADLMQYCLDNDGSPATAIALFLARVIKKLHPHSEKPIGCGMATNLRKAFGTPRSHHSNLAIPVLDFTDQIAAKPFALQGTAFRGQVLLKYDPEVLREDAYASAMLYGLIDSLPTCEQKQQTMERIIKSMFRGPTVSVSYVGRSNLGACEKYIRRLYTEVTGTGIMVELNAVNDVFCMEFIQEWAERDYFDLFCQELEACNIRYGLESEGFMEISKVAAL